MAKMFNWRKPEGNPATNGFDVSRRDTYSTSPGILNVIRPRVVGPKSKFKINLADCIFNTLPTVNQPFNRGSFYVDLYQVPITQIMHRFDDFYTQLSEKFSSSGFAPDDDEIKIPNLIHIDLWTLTSLIVVDLKYYFDTVQSYSDSSYFWFAGDLNRYDASVFDSNSALGVDVHGYPVAFGLLRLLDMLEYSNWYLYIKDFFLNSASADEGYNTLLSLWVQTVFDDIVSGEDTTDAFQGEIDDLVDSLRAASAADVRNAISLVFDHIHQFNMFSSMPHQLYANMLNLFAYQKVFNDIYRNSFYDKEYPFAFNMDWFVEKGLQVDKFEFFDILEEFNGVSRVDSPLAYKVFEIHYRQFKNDMFTSLLPNSQFGDVSMVNVGDSVFNLKASPVGDGSRVLGVGPDGIVTTRTSSSPSGAERASFEAGSLTFSVLMQRRAEALQKYKERFLRAGNRLKDQYVSEFGKVPYYLEDKYVRYLGSMSSALKVQGVPATSDSGEYNVGERAAYGYAGIDGSIDLSVDDWSIIVPIMYYLPETDYEAFGLGAQNKFSEFSDYYVPEFENLGLEPVYRTTLSLLATTLAGGSYEVGGERVIGYGPSYMYFKTDIDKVHGEFGSTGYLNGIYSSWVTTRGNVSMSELSDYYVRPDFCNSIFKTQYNGSQHTDQFLCCLGFDWKAIEPLSVVGLPIWE